MQSKTRLVVHKTALVYLHTTSVFQRDLSVYFMLSFTLASLDSEKTGAYL